MTLRTADQYKSGIRDDRVVYILGKRVEDVTEDPFIKVGVETAAYDFIMGHDEKHRELAVIKDPETDEDISRYFEIQDNPDAVRSRHELIKTSSRYADGALPFIKDVGTDILNALAIVTGMMGNEDYSRRLTEYRNYCARKDLSLAGAVTDVKGDRSKGPGEQATPDYYLRIVDETEDSIIVSGAKAHITAGAYVDEIIVIPTRNMDEADSDYAVAFAVPANTPGITQICRPNFRYEDKYHFPTPRPKRGHIESLVIFDNVKVPIERVFMKRESAFAQYLAYAFTANHRFTALTYKIPILQYMTGLGMLAAEANGVQKASHIRERFVNMIRYTETTRALAIAALQEPENFAHTGFYVANRLIANMAKLYFATHYHEFVRDIQDIAGGLLVTQPTYQDWINPEIKPFLERYMGGAGKYNAEERLKLMSTLHHTIASDFSGWHEVCTIHAEGSIATQKMMLLMEAEMDEYKNLAKKYIGLNV